MRVISGKYKDRKILVESKSHYRPTLTRVREDIIRFLISVSKDVLLIKISNNRLTSSWFLIKLLSIKKYRAKGEYVLSLSSITYLTKKID